MKKHLNDVESNSAYYNRVARARVVADKQNHHEPGLSIHENIASLFQPDTAIAEQYFENLRKKAILKPEKRLMLAVLEDAIHSFQDNVSQQSDKAKRVFNAAEEWILKRDKDWIFSFDTICEALSFDPRYVRQGLLRWKQQQLRTYSTMKSGETTRYAAMGGRK